MAAIYLLHSSANEPPLARHIGSLISASGRDCPVQRFDLLIRWGNADGDDSIARRVLNRREPLIAAMTPGRAATILVRSGLKVHSVPTGERLRVRDYFRVHALDFQLVFLGRREPGRYGFQEITPQHSSVSEKAVRYAYRALYALGLDFGAVDVIVGKNGKLAILRVDPLPVVDGRLADHYADKLSEYLRSLNSASFPDVRLGADPEFVIRKDGGQMVPASRFFPADGDVGCDAIFIRSAQGAIVKPLAELRPPASESPAELVRSMHRLLAKAAARAPYSNLQFRAGSLPYPGFPIGGHIHFSGIGRVSGKILRALDTYLSVPLLLVENTATSRMRRPRYGFLGDWRPQPWGYEYRTPASWLISPRIARAVLALAKVIAVHHRQLDRDIFIDQDLVDAFYGGNKEPFYLVAGRLFDELSEMPAYREHSLEIAPLRQLIAQRRQWSERVDIRRTWKVPVSSRTYQA